MEKACKENIVVKAMAEDTEPDHDTIATFISINSKAVKDLFIQVLLQCSALNLITGEMFAIDGCKLSSNVSKEWSGKINDLKKKKTDLEKLLTRILFQHKEMDNNAVVKKIQEPFRKTLGEDAERHERHIRRIEEKLKKINTFLPTAEQQYKENLSEKMREKIDNPAYREWTLPQPVYKVKQLSLNNIH